MRFAKLNLDDKLGLARSAIENVRRQAYIMERIGQYEYNEGRLEAGMGLIGLIDSLSLDWNAAQSGKKLATRRLREAWEQSAVMYKKTRRVAQMVFRDQPHQVRALALENPSARYLAKYLEETNQFYTNALADPEMCEMRVGIDCRDRTARCRLCASFIGGHRRMPRRHPALCALARSGLRMALRHALGGVRRLHGRRIRGHFGAHEKHPRDDGRERDGQYDPEIPVRRDHAGLLFRRLFG